MKMKKKLKRNIIISIRFGFGNNIHTCSIIMRSIANASMSVAKYHAQLLLRPSQSRFYTGLGGRKFVDKVIVEARGGKGGNGCVSFEVLSPSKRRYVH